MLISVNKSEFYCIVKMKALNPGGLVDTCMYRSVSGVQGFIYLKVGLDDISVLVTKFDINF